MILHALTGLWRSSPKQDPSVNRDAAAKLGAKSMTPGKPPPPRAPLTPAYQQTLKAFASFTQIAQGFPPAPRAAAKPDTPAPTPVVAVDPLPKAQVDDVVRVKALIALDRVFEELKDILSPSKDHPIDKYPLGELPWHSKILPLVISAAKEMRIAQENGATDAQLGPLCTQMKSDIVRLLDTSPAALDDASLDELQSTVEAMKTLGVQSKQVAAALVKRSTNDGFLAQVSIADAWTAMTVTPPNYAVMLVSLDKALGYHQISVAASRLAQKAEGHNASTPSAFDAGKLRDAMPEMNEAALAGLDSLFHGRLGNIEKALALAGKHDTVALLGQMRDAVKAALTDKDMASNPTKAGPGSVGKLLGPALEGLQVAVPMELTKTGEVHKGNANWNAQKALAGQLEALQRKPIQQHVDTAGLSMSQEMWDDMGRPNCSYRIQPHTGPVTALGPRAFSSGHLSVVDMGEKSLRLAVSRFANHEAVRDCVGKLMESEDNPIRLPDGRQGKFSGANASYGFTLGRAADGRVTVQCEYVLRDIAGFQGPDGAGTVNGGFVHLDPAKSHARFTYEVTVSADGSAELTKPLACEFCATPSAWQRDYPKPQGIADLVDAGASPKMQAAFRRAAPELGHGRVQWPGATQQLLGFHAAHAEFEKNPTLAHARNLQRLYTHHDLGIEKSVWDSLGKVLRDRDAAHLSTEKLLAFLKPARDHVDALLQKRLDRFVGPPSPQEP